MKNRKKFNEIYKGVFNQEKKVTPIQIDNNLTKPIKEKEITIFQAKTIDNKKEIAIDSSTELHGIDVFKVNLNKLNKYIKGDKVFILKRQLISDIFMNNYNLGENLFSENINSLFITNKRDKRISFMKENTKTMHNNLNNSVRAIIDYDHLPTKQEQLNESEIQTKIKNNYLMILK